MQQDEGESNSQEWPVKLFRLGQDARWEQAHTSHELKVSPRRNAIAFPSIRYRIKFQNSSSPEQQQQQEADNNSQTVTIMRRCERISVTTMQPEQPTRCAVLQFCTEADCVAFSDELMRLNSNIGIGTANEIEAMHAASMSMLDEPDEAIGDIRGILMSEDFMEFVDRLEESLNSCPEGVALLDSLVDTDGDEGMQKLHTQI